MKPIAQCPKTNPNPLLNTKIQHHISLISFDVGNLDSILGFLRIDYKS